MREVLLERAYDILHVVRSSLSAACGFPPRSEVPLTSVGLQVWREA